MEHDKEALELIELGANVPGHKYKIEEIELYRKKKREISFTRILEQANSDAEIIIQKSKTR